MKRLKKNFTYLTTVLLACSIILFSSCNNSTEPVDPQAQFVGTWSLDQINVAIGVDGKSLEEFLMDDGASEEEIAIIQEGLFSFLEDEFGEGEITLNADNTYVANFGSDTDSGTWAYNNSTGILTINSNDGQQEIDVKSITASTLIIIIEEILFGDINDDQIDDEISVYMEQNYNKVP